MCAELGVKHAGPNWCSHYAELRRGDGVFVRLTRAQCIAWWRERFSDSELRAMGSAIDFLTVEEGGSGF